jgi:hypothetical protein
MVPPLTTSTTFPEISFPALKTPENFLSSEAEGEEVETGADTATGFGSGTELVTDQTLTLASLAVL